MSAAFKLITLRLGATGEAVWKWQEVLELEPTGTFDAETETATRMWQANRGLLMDGVVGPQTWGVAGFGSGETQVPVVRTVVTEKDYAAALLRAWTHLGLGTPSKQSVGVLWSQYMQETGGRACFNWNIGNAKDRDGDGLDYMCLAGVWEGVTPAVAARLLASGEAIEDKSPDHAKSVGPGKVSVIFPPPHPASRFRAFPDLATSMEHHLRLLSKYYAAAWAMVLVGRPRECATALGGHGYFTANATVYGNGMAAHFDAFMRRTTSYEAAVAELAAIREADTSPEVPNPPSGDDELDELEVVVEPGSIIHPRVPLGLPGEEDELGVPDDEGDA